MGADDLIEKLWDTSQRLAMQIDAMPPRFRNQGYEATAEAMRDTAPNLKMSVSSSFFRFN